MSDSDSARRRLTLRERELWVQFTRSVAPLRPGTEAPGPIETPSETTAEAVSSPASAVSNTPTAVPRNEPPSLAALDRRLRHRLARGRALIDARLDLHGLSQAEAHDALVGFLRRARARGARIVLIITGKGTADMGRGVLRRQVPQWLRSTKLREYVVGLEPAGPAHGGEGALYVRLRRARRETRPDVTE